MTIRKWAKGLVIGMGTLVLLLSSVYIVDESEQAVVETFREAGKVVTQPGPHLKLPFVQRVHKISKETFSLQFGYKEENGEVIEEHLQDTKMITGDENILLADMVVQWKIVDPIQYLYASENPDTILYNASSASLRRVIGSSHIDEALTTGKAKIESQTHEALSALLDDYDIGIAILAVKLQDVELPTDEVRQAFTQVTDARENMNTSINKAQQYRNQKINEAKGTVDAILSKAQADKTTRVEAAKGDVAVFNALYAQYAKQPDITRTRLTLETLEEVFPKAKIFITDSASGGAVPYMLLDPSKTPAPKKEGN